MFDEPFRAHFAIAVRPLARWIVRRGISANQVTVATFLIALAAGGLIATHQTYAGLAVWLVSRIGDGLDGVVAREARSSTPFGGFLDITLDMCAYTAMVLAFAAIYPESGLAWVAVLAGYVVVITTTLALSDAAGVLARRVTRTNRTFQFTRGLAEAGETSAMYILWVIFPEHVPWLAWLWVLLLAATALQRAADAWHHLRRE